MHSAKAEEAMRLMESGNDSILQISELLFYSSSSYFCSCFEKVTEMRLGQYRRKEDMMIETTARR
ncbi:MAG: hypothetical protein MR607_07465 [Lachnospiraceae bacterium]|nr:hypothetical protein [Lachnospiraceae bacterium]